MAWPAYWDLPAGEVDRGTIYVPRHRLPSIIEHHKHAGRAWTFNDRYSTYCPNQKLSYKSTASFGRDLDADRWRSIMAESMAVPLDPPSSYSDMYSQLVRVPWPRRSLINPFRRFHLDGGWQQAFHHGRTNRPLYYYDMRSAYRWASLAPLPDMRTAMWYDGWSKCDRGIALVKLKANTLPYAPRAGWHLLTTEERDYFKIIPEAIHCMITFPNTITLDWASIDHAFPTSSKRMGQHFWGLWACRQSVVMQTWRSQTLTALPNRAYNPILAHYIVSRVKLRLVERMAELGSRNIHMVFVDALLTSEPMAEGNAVGDFRLKHHVPAGGVVIGPGVWGRLDGELIKHAGSLSHRLDRPIERMVA